MSSDATSFAGHASHAPDFMYKMVEIAGEASFDRAFC
jgi:hypothetical protein